MNKAGHEYDRSNIKHFQQIINVGPAIESDFHVLDLSEPQQLIGKNPWQLYVDLCRRTNTMHDPCVLDVLIASVDYMNGNPPKKWWDFTSTRKQTYTSQITDLRTEFQP